MTNNLRAKHDRLLAAHPALRAELWKGLALSLTGSVTGFIGEQGRTAWAVSGGTVEGGKRGTYYVTLEPGDRWRWHCTCKAHSFSAPEVELFAGYPGRVCKHIAAVGLCFNESGAALDTDNPGLPANLWEAVTRLVEAGVMPSPTEPLDIPGNSARLMQRGDGRVILKIGHITSGPIARWVTDISRQSGGGIWVLEADGSIDIAKDNYDQWVAKIKEAQNGA